MAGLDYAGSVNPFLARLGLALGMLLLPLQEGTATFLPVLPIAALLLVGAFTRTAALLALFGALRGIATALQVAGLLGSLPYVFGILTLTTLARRLIVAGPGAWAIDPLPWATWFPQVDWAGLAAKRDRFMARSQQRIRETPSFAFRFPYSFALLVIGELFVLRGDPLVAALGVAWMLGGLALALGFLTPWTALYCALVIPLAIPATGSWFWLAPAVGVLPVALVQDDRITLDRLLARRGGLFPAFRREVVLEPVRPR
jgi:uncharacterized membrane protein YphA (DoxX/SURF4 family)